MNHQQKVSSKIVVLSGFVGFTVALFFAYHSSFSLNYASQRYTMWLITGAIFILMPIPYFVWPNIRRHAYQIQLFGFAAIFLDAIWEKGLDSPILVFFNVAPVMMALILNPIDILASAVLANLLLGIIAHNNGYESLRLFSMVGQNVYLAIISFLFSDSETKLRLKISAEKENVESLLRILNHDINNHLMVVINQADLLLARQPDSRNLQMLLRASEKISAIAENSRNLLAIQSGKRDLKVEKVNLVPICQEIEADFAYLLTQKKLTMKLDFAGQSSYLVKGNQHILLSSILPNLVSNAIKFSHSGTQIEIKIVEINKKVVLSVTDSGIGIPPEQLAHIFEANKKTSRQGTAGETGTGFGLPNVKYLLDLMHAEISVSSNAPSTSGVSEGTTFSISFEPCDKNPI